MTRRIACAAFVVLVAASVAFSHAQSPGRPQFRSGVEYVEVDVRVVDAGGRPVGNLAQSDFAVVEDGVPQTLRTFAAVDLPLPSGKPQAISPTGVRPDVSSNVLTSLRGRTYLIVLDTLNIDPLRSAVVRRFLNTFVDRSIGPDDLVGISTTGVDAAHQAFTNDKARMRAAIGQLFGQGGSPAVANADSIVTKSLMAQANVGGPAQPSHPEIVDVGLTGARLSQQRLQEFVSTMGSAMGGSKAILLISEAVPFEMITNTNALVLIGGSERLREAARRGNVPIYPVDPRGLTSGGEDTIQIGKGGIDDSPGQTLLAEVRRQQDRLRVLADDSGGVPIITNDINGALDRVVELSSRYYILGYDSTNGRSDGKYRRITIRVSRPGVSVLARHGYTAQAASTAVPKAPSLPGPPGSSVELREALNAVLPMPDLPMLTTAAAFRQPGSRAVSVAVVLETLGSELAWRPNDSLAAPLEMTAVALEPKGGGIKTGFVDHAHFDAKSDAGDRVRQFGFRWLARLTGLKPGSYQIRVATANGPGRAGSAWLDLEIPDFSKAPIAMSDVLVASVVASRRPTLRPDPLLADALPAPPTTLRSFPSTDMLAVYAEVYDNDTAAHQIETTVVVTNEQGELKSRTVATEARGNGVVPIKKTIPLVSLTPGYYTLAVEARQTSNRAISAGRALPFQIVDAGNK